MQIRCLFFKERAEFLFMHVNIVNKNKTKHVRK